MNHFLLAEAPSEGSTDTRYGAVSLPLLRQNLCAVGCQKARLKAVVAGGSDLLSNMRAIGTENARFALDWLAQDGIVVEREDIGSARARRVRFSPSSGVCEIIHVQSPPR
ncbi:MAG: chemotaxis protein CheD [Pseudomonadota bacterium]